jgi:hypothetical protein
MKRKYIGSNAFSQVLWKLVTHFLGWHDDDEEEYILL